VRALLAILTALIVVAVAAGSAAAATPVGGTFAGSPEATVAKWTPARRATAVPLSLLPLSRAGTLAGDRDLTATSAAGATTSAVREGTDTGEPTLFPNRANGIVYGTYLIDGSIEAYQCSGSVIDSPQGDVVLTAGHCVIDPETGAVARSVAFIPGYREGVEPYGSFAATGWVTTPEWTETAGGVRPDEGGDLAMLVLAPSAATGLSVEATVGALAIGFEAGREGTYTQWGYPGLAPYDGEVLYSNTSAYAGSDFAYSPAPIKIASDFTAGASGGPWTIGPSASPTVVSLTDYYYESDPKHLYGAYFGSAARAVYEAAAEVVVPPAPSGGTSTTTTTTTPPTDATPEPTPSAGPPPAAVSPVPSQAAAPTPASGRVRILAVHGHAGGGATVLVGVGGPGTLRLSGPAVRTVSVVADLAGDYRIGVRAKAASPAARALRRRGSATVGVWVRFTSPVGVRHASRLVRL